MLFILLPKFIAFILGKNEQHGTFERKVRSTRNLHVTFFKKDAQTKQLYITIISHNDTAQHPTWKICLRIELLRHWNWQRMNLCFTPFREVRIYKNPS